MVESRPFRWLLRTLGNDRVFNLRFALLLVLVKGLSHVQFGILFSSVWVMLQILFTKFVIYSLLIWVRAKKMKWHTAKHRALANSIWLGIVCFTSTLVADFTLNQLGEITPVTFPMQVLADLLTTLFVFVAYSQVNLVAHDYADHINFMSTLDLRIHELQDSMQQMVDKSAVEMRNDTQKSFSEDFALIQQNIHEHRQVTKVIALIDEFRDEKIRPLSQRFHGNLQEIGQRAREIEISAPLSIPKKFAVANGINVYFLAYLNVFGFFGQYAIFGLKALPATVATSALELSILYLLKIFLPKREINTYLALFILFILSFAIALVTTEFVHGFDLHYHAADATYWQEFWLNVQLTPVVYVLIGYTELIRSNIAESSESTQKLQAEFENQMRIFNQHLWVAQKRWAQYLHGTVQSALNAAAIRLQQNSNEDAAWAQFEKDFAVAESLISNYREDPILISEVINSLRKIWVGVIEIEFNSQNVDLKEIELDQSACFALTEIWRECISNAVRHGSASIVKIDLRQKGSEVETTIANNGSIPSKVAKANLGTAILDDLTIEWWFDLPPNKSEMVEVHAKLILA